MPIMTGLFNCGTIGLLLGKDWVSAVVKMIRNFAILVSLTVFGASVYNTMQYWDYQELLPDLNKALLEKN